jgi:hypothetical protein
VPLSTKQTAQGATAAAATHLAPGGEDPEPTEAETVAVADHRPPAPAAAVEQVGGTVLQTAPTRPTGTKGVAKVVNKYRGMGLDTVYGNKDGSSNPGSSDALCELNLYYGGNCYIEQGKETWMECARRIGPKRLDRVINTRCKALPVWRSLIANDTDGTDEGWEKLKRGWVYDVETYASESRDTYVPPHKRSIAKYHPPRKCARGCLQFPISFSIPQGNVAPYVNRDKWWGFLPYIPGTFPFGGDPKYHFGYQDEWLKDQLHRHSFFAWSHKRGGWDCMRHLEILSSGAIPYFADLDLCPKMTLSNYPKELIKQAMALPGLEHIGQVRRHEERMDTKFMIRNPRGHVNFKRTGELDFAKFDAEAYFDIADQILNHTRQYMTTAATVAYILKTIKYEEPKHVLMIGRWTYDYLHQTIESGLSDLGIRTTVLGHTTDWVLKKKLDPSKPPPTEAEMEDFRMDRQRQSGHKQIPGLAWFYGFRNLPHITRHSNKGRHDSDIRRRILDNEFDLVIYTYTENEPMSRRWYWNEVSRVVPKERRVFLHHNDDVGDPDRGSAESCKNGWLFKREMHDVGC